MNYLLHVLRLGFCSVLLASLVTTCKSREESALSQEATPTPNSVQWIQKVRYVTNGYAAPTLGEFFDPNDYVNKSSIEVVEEFMTSPRFAATLMQMHLFYLDALTDQIKSIGIERLLNNSQGGALFEYPAVQSASFEVMRGKDYLKALWAPEHKVLSQASSVTKFFDDYARSPGKKRDALTREGFYRRFRDRTTVTNFHRARAASILKTYFCDELNLDKAVLEDLMKGLAEAHSEDKKGHASPTCMSCHFRLDPIGAYFRYYNADGSYWNERDIVMVNGNVPDVQTKYLKEWTNAQGEIVTGYALSPAQIISHGDDLPSLFSVIADPQISRTRECLVKRTAQFFTSSKQIYDVEWIRDLATEFDRQPDDSSAAMRKIIARILASETYKQMNPDFKQCYDQKDPRPDAPPCALRYLTNEYCVECHNSDVEAINLSRWVPGPDGKAIFANTLGKNRTEMVDHLLNSLEGKNGMKKMPLENSMPLDHKQTLVDELLKIRNQP